MTTATTTTTFGHRASDLFDTLALNYDATAEGNTIVVHDEVELGTDALATINFIALLQTALTHDVQVRWTGVLTSSSRMDTAPLHHLYPPTTLVGLPPEHLRTWRAAFRYGLCYFRRGPDFIMVKDARLGTGDVHLTIDHPDLLATFLAACAPQRDSTLRPIQREAAAVLASENLIYRLDDLVLTLPTRIRRWPIPFSAL